jgi:hypothetical protein
VGYSAAAGNGGYAVLLATLAAPCPGSQQAFISPDLSLDPSVKSGFTVTLVAGAGAVAGPNDCNATATQTAYYVTATPLTLGTTGNRSFASTASGSIFYNNTAVAPTEAVMAPGGGGTTIQ